MQTYIAFLFRLALHVVEGNIYNKIYRSSVGRTQASAPFSPAGRRVSTQFYFRIRLLDFREFMGLGLPVMYPFPSSSGGLGGTFYTDCSPISCRNKLKTCQLRSERLHFRNRCCIFVPTEHFIRSPFSLLLSHT